MTWRSKTTDTLVRFAAKSAAEDTGKRIMFKGRAIYVEGRMVVEGSNEELFGYLNGLADGFDMAGGKRRSR